MGARVLITIIIFFLLFVSIYFPGDLLEDQFANAHKYHQCVVVHNFTSGGMVVYNLARPNNRFFKHR